MLVVDDDPASRLTLQTVLEAGGYAVDSAATASEAVDKLQDHQYELVLSEMQMESPEAGLKVLAYAQSLAYEPATALIQSCARGETADRSRSSLLVATEDIPGLLGMVANLIGRRVTKRMNRELRQSKN